jgi:hypothetical protein
MKKNAQPSLFPGCDTKLGSSNEEKQQKHMHATYSAHVLEPLKHSQDNLFLG